MLWVNLPQTYSKYDAAEPMVHELAHQLIFHDEIVHQHYSDYGRLHDPSLYATSAILRLRRPIDMVFHSVIVAHMVLSYRRIHSHPDSYGSTIHGDSLVLQRSAYTSALMLLDMDDKEKVLIGDARSWRAFWAALKGTALLNEDIYRKRTVFSLHGIEIVKCT